MSSICDSFAGCHGEEVRRYPSPTQKLMLTFSVVRTSCGVVQAFPNFLSMCSMPQEEYCTSSSSLVKSSNATSHSQRIESSTTLRSKAAFLLRKTACTRMARGS